MSLCNFHSSCLWFVLVLSFVPAIRLQMNFPGFGGQIWDPGNTGYGQWNNDPYADPALSPGGFHPQGHMGNGGFMGTGSSCQGRIINPMTHICCQGFGVPRCASYHSRCCAGKCFNPQAQLCCGVEVVGRCGPQSTCCGNFCFNPTTQICCGGFVAGRCGPSSQCCGRLCFNPQTQMCCSGTPVGHCAGAFSGCCGRVCYDRRFLRCCPGHVLKKHCDFGPFGGNAYTGDVFGNSMNPAQFNSPQMPQFGYNPNFMG